MPETQQAEQIRQIVKFLTADFFDIELPKIKEMLQSYINETIRVEDGREKVTLAFLLFSTINGKNLLMKDADFANQICECIDKTTFNQLTENSESVAFFMFLVADKLMDESITDPSININGFKDKFKLDLEPNTFNKLIKGGEYEGQSVAFAMSGTTTGLWLLKDPNFEGKFNQMLTPKTLSHPAKSMRYRSVASGLALRAHLDKNPMMMLLDIIDNKASITLNKVKTLLSCSSTFDLLKKHHPQLVEALITFIDKNKPIGLVDKLMSLIANNETISPADERFINVLIKHPQLEKAVNTWIDKNKPIDFMRQLMRQVISEKVVITRDNPKCAMITISPVNESYMKLFINNHDKLFQSVANKTGFEWVPNDILETLTMSGSPLNRVVNTSSGFWRGGPFGFFSQCPKYMREGMSEIAKRNQTTDNVPVSVSFSL